MTARWITADVFDGLATLEDGSVDLIVTSPPFLALRSYLPADHPDKSKEIGSEATPAEFIDTLLAVTAELRRVLAPHGSICVELGDTYAGSGGGGGDYSANGLREGQPVFDGSGKRVRETRRESFVLDGVEPPARRDLSKGWPLAKSRALIPQLYEIALAYGINPLTGQPSPAGQWRIRNVVTWTRPNPPVGALGDKWRPATSDLIVACTSSKRYWDDLATRKINNPDRMTEPSMKSPWNEALGNHTGDGDWHSHGAPLLDYWEIPPGGYQGAHYAVFPPELVVPCVKAMCPEKVCRVCGEPSRRIMEKSERYGILRAAIGDKNKHRTGSNDTATGNNGDNRAAQLGSLTAAEFQTIGWTDCGHDDYRPGVVLDPFAGSGTTLAVATGHGHDAIGIDLDPRNADLARERIGPFLFEEVTV